MRYDLRYRQWLQPKMNGRSANHTYRGVPLSCLVVAVAGFHPFPFERLGGYSISLLHAHPPESVQLFPGLISEFLR